MGVSPRRLGHPHGEASFLLGAGQPDRAVVEAPTLVAEVTGRPGSTWAPSPLVLEEFQVYGESGGQEHKAKLLAPFPGR